MASPSSPAAAPRPRPLLGIADDVGGWPGLLELGEGLVGDEVTATHVERPAGGYTNIMRKDVHG